MNADGLLLLATNVHDFKRAALHMEQEIKVAGLSINNEELLPDDSDRTYTDLWISKKTVSLFNLGIALELMLKLLLGMHEMERPKNHSLIELYDGLPSKVRKELEKAYQKELKNSLDGGRFLSFIDHPVPRPEKTPRPKTPNIKTLSGFFEFLDSQALLSTMRYSWERLSEYSWKYYIDDVSLFVNLIDSVMYSIRVPDFLNPHRPDM